MTIGQLTQYLAIQMNFSRFGRYHAAMISKAECGPQLIPLALTFLLIRGDAVTPLGGNVLQPE